LIYGIFMFFVLFSGGFLSGSVSHLGHVAGIVAGAIMLKYPQILSYFASLRVPFFQKKGPKVAYRNTANMGHPGRHSDPDDRYNDPHWYLDQ